MTGSIAYSVHSQNTKVIFAEKMFYIYVIFVAVLIINIPVATTGFYTAYIQSLVHNISSANANLPRNVLLFFEG